jgi:uncharacterized protein
MRPDVPVDEKERASFLTGGAQGRRAIFPVIHVLSTKQAMSNAVLAREAGADGLFLINHDVGPDELFRIFLEVRREFPRWWLGLNILGLEPVAAIERLTPQVDGFWLNDACVREAEGAQDDAATLRRQLSAWPGLYFGGVAFKHQRPVADVAVAARLAQPYVDVVTTSGEATGQAPSIDKVRRMSRALGEHPLAVASGMTPQNISKFLPYVRFCLVATGVSRTFHEFDPLFLTQLIAATRAYDRSRNLC